MKFCACLNLLDSEKKKSSKLIVALNDQKHIAVLKAMGDSHSFQQKNQRFKGMQNDTTINIRACMQCKWPVAINTQKRKV